MRARLAVRDVFGLTRSHLPGRDERRLLPVRPAALPARSAPRIDAAVGDDTTRRRRSSDEERYYMREYEPGDRLKDINWKASSRLNELITRISPVSEQQTRLLHVELRHYRPAGPETLDSVLHLDYLKSWLLTFLRAVKAEHEDFTFRVITGAGEHDVDTVEDIDDLARRLASVTFAPGPEHRPEVQPHELFIFTTAFDAALATHVAQLGDTALHVYRTVSAIPPRSDDDDRIRLTLLRPPSASLLPALVGAAPRTLRARPLAPRGERPRRRRAPGGRIVMTLLFATRLLVYLVAIAIPIVHPAVTISYDRVGWVTWFALVPLEMALAAFLKPPRLRLSYWLAAALGLAVVAAVAGPGVDTSSLTVIGIGLLAFVLTAMVFHGREHGHVVAVAELLFVGYVLLKLLRFSRANDVIAEESLRITTALVVMITCGFLLHALALYLAAFPESGGRFRRRELATFALGALPVSIALGALLPPDFVSNRIAFNNLNEVAVPEPQPVGADSSGPPGGNLRPLDPPQDPSQRQGQGGQGEQSEAGGEGGQGDDAQNQQGEGGQGEGGQADRQQSLEGVPAERWNDSGAGQGEGPGGGQGRQGRGRDNPEERR